MPKLQNIIAIFFLLNALGTLPLFLTLTKEHGFSKKARIALTANITAILLLSVFVCLGEKLMIFFGLSLSAFEIGGGIILFRIGLEMLNCTLTLEGHIKEASKIESQGSCAIVPLGIPLLAGPGSIAVIMTMTVTMAGKGGTLPILAALATASVLSLTVWVLGGYIFLQFLYFRRKFAEEDSLSFVELQSILR